MTKERKNADDQVDHLTTEMYADRCAAIMEEIEMALGYHDRDIEHCGEEPFTDAMIRDLYQHLLDRVERISPLKSALHNLPRLSSENLTCLRNQIAGDLLNPAFSESYSSHEIVSVLRQMISFLDLLGEQASDRREYITSVRDRYDDVLPELTWEVVSVTNEPLTLSQIQEKFRSEVSRCCQRYH